MIRRNLSIGTATIHLKQRALLGESDKFTEEVRWDSGGRKQSWRPSAVRKWRHLNDIMRKQGDYDDRCSFHYLRRKTELPMQRLM